MNGVYPPDEFGGAENYVHRTAKALRHRGHDAIVLTTTKDPIRKSYNIEKETYDEVPVFRFHPFNISHRSDGTGGNIVTKALWHQFDTVNPHAKRVVARFLKSQQPDIVHSNNFMGITASAGKAISEADVRYVHTLHDYSLICPKSNLLRDLTAPDDTLEVCESPPAPCRLYADAKKRMIGKPDLVIGPSRHIIEVHRRHGFFEDTETARIQHGIERFADSIPESVSDSVLFVGKHLRAKGLDTLFEAARTVGNVMFHLCGTGPYDHRSESVAAELENVQYHGFVSDERLRELRREVSAAVVPSIWMENSPLTVYESFAEGLPVIGADIGGIPELVSHERGRLFTPGDDGELADCVFELTKKVDLMELRMNAYEWARAHTIKNHIDDILDCYDI